jgi:DNA-binding PucR family transcriptional regulator
LRESFSLNRTFESLEEFVDTVSGRLQCPVTMEDANHHLLAYSSHAGETDEARVATIIGRRVPEKVINKFWKEGIIPKLNQQDEPLVIPPIEDIGLGRRVAAAIRRKGEVLGYLWVIDTYSRLTEEDLEDLQLASSKAAHQLLQMSRQRRKREKSREELLWQMLTGEAGTHEDILRQLSEIGIRTDLPLAVIVFRFEQIDEAHYQKLAYAAKTTQKLHVLIDTRDDEQAVLLVAPHHHDTYETSALQFTETLLARMPEKRGIWSGCGSACSDYEGIEESFHEAQRTAELKQKHPEALQGVRFYKELGIFRYVTLLEDTGKLEQLPLPTSLLTLASYDRENNAHMIDTLEKYLAFDGSMAQTARALHVHVNTLGYRLRRMEEIAGISLKNPAQKAGLYLDLQLFRNRLC